MKYSRILLYTAVALLVIAGSLWRANIKDTIAQDNTYGRQPVSGNQFLTGNRFQIESVQNFDQLSIAEIIVDRQTNVKYLFVKIGEGAGLTKLETGK